MSLNGFESLALTNPAVDTPRSSPAAPERVGPGRFSQVNGPGRGPESPFGF